jgi:predicted enzyme related to lactoylglutathione lyase
MKANMCGWFEIPVSDMDRARQFYEKVFDIKIHIQELGITRMGWFPMAEDPEARGASGSLVFNPDFYKPSSSGVLIYFSSKDISEELARVEAAGGSVLREKTLIAEGIGYMGLFLDSEGNRIALHSRE